MDLNEPRKKKRKKRLGGRHQSQPPPLPINTSENGDWRIYTAHLSACGTCIVDPGEMEAVYTMGFFGKGSLSRSYPSFGRRRLGAPPVVRNRQWIRRQRWLDELQELNDETSLEVHPESEEQTDNVKVKDGYIQDSPNPETSSVDKKMNTDETEKKSLEIPQDKIRECRDENSEKTVDNEEQKRDRDSTEINSTDSPTNPETHLQSQIASGNKVKSAILITEEKHEKERDSEPCTKKAKLDAEELSESRNKDESKIVAEKNNENLDSMSNVSKEFGKKNEVLLDSTEEEEVCEIVEKDEENDGNKDLSLQDDIYVLDYEKNDKMNFCDFDDDNEDEDEEEEDPYEVLVLPDTDSETENYLNNVKPRIERQGFPINESLHLTFEETFFLMYGLGCLQLINYDGSVIGINDAWKHFELQDKSFVQRYIVYHYFRSKGWVVKPGLKYGGDFLLYKQGPAFYHASYIVVIEVMDADTLIRDDARSLRKMSWTNLMGLERLSETIAKEILFAQILWPSSLSKNVGSITVESLSEMTVRELLWRRWDPKRRPEIVSLEDDELDST